MIQQQQGIDAQPLPQDVYQQSMAYQLGTFNTIYKPRISNPFLVLAITAGIIVADIVLFIILLMAGWIFYLLIIVPIFAIIYAIYGLMHANLRVYEFSHGLIQKKGSKLDIIRWDQVSTVWQVTKASSGSYLYGALGALLFGSRIKQIFTLHRQDGAKFIFDTQRIKDVGSLGETIQREVAQAHMPQAIAAYNAGNTIPFGPFNLTQQGIANSKGAVLPWMQVNGVTFNRGNAVIMQTGNVQKWFSAPISKIPNLEVFTNLVSYAAQGARSQS